MSTKKEKEAYDKFIARIRGARYRGTPPNPSTREGRGGISPIPYETGRGAVVLPRQPTTPMSGKAEPSEHGMIPFPSDYPSAPSNPGSSEFQGQPVAKRARTSSIDDMFNFNAVKQPYRPSSPMRAEQQYEIVDEPPPPIPREMAKHEPLYHHTPSSFERLHEEWRAVQNDAASAWRQTKRAMHPGNYDFSIPRNGREGYDRILRMRERERNPKEVSNAQAAGGLAAAAAITAFGAWAKYKMEKHLRKRKRGEGESEFEGAGQISGTTNPSSSQQYHGLDTGGPTAEQNIVGSNTLPSNDSKQASEAYSSGHGGMPPSEPPSQEGKEPGLPYLAPEGAGAGQGPGGAAGEALPTAEGAGLKATGPNMDRLNPITAATGAQNTPANSNESVSIAKFAADVHGTQKTLGNEEVFGNARERANMGKGAETDYAYNGPYDCPTYPGGKANTDLTLMGAWRTKNGNTSHLYFGNKKKDGGPALRNKYFKWSSKGGGGWKKLNNKGAMNVFQKPGRLEGGNFFGRPWAGTKLTDILKETMIRKNSEQKMAEVGAEKQELNKVGKGTGETMK